MTRHWQILGSESYTQKTMQTTSRYDDDYMIIIFGKMSSGSKKIQIP
jgi:hypothetical protein